MSLEREIEQSRAHLFVGDLSLLVPVIILTVYVCTGRIYQISHFRHVFLPNLSHRPEYPYFGAMILIGGKVGTLFTLEYVPTDIMG